MNKQELIERIEGEKFIKNSSDFEIGYNLASNTILRYIKQLDEQKKPVVPQFIADWIEKCKAKEKSLLNALLYTPEGVNGWVDDPDNQETFALAWIFGYKDEEEKLFKVRLKGTSQYLCNDDTGLHFQHGFKTDFTKEYLEQAGFGWVFDCEWIEIEEVEE